MIQSTETPQPPGATKALGLVKRGALPAAALGVGAVVGNHGVTPDQVFEFVKSVGVPSAALLAVGVTLKEWAELGAARISDWVERCAGFVAPRADDATAAILAIAESTKETAAAARRTSERVDEADDQGKRDHADLADLVRQSIQAAERASDHAERAHVAADRSAAIAERIARMLPHPAQEPGLTPEA